MRSKQARRFVKAASCAVLVVLCLNARAIGEGFGNYYAAAIQAMKDKSVLNASGNFAGTPSTRSISTTSPLTGGGDLSTDRTFALGTVPATLGGTGQTTFARGDTLYASAANTLSKATIGAANKVWHSDGTDPSWQALVAADIPSACTNVTSLGTLTALTMGGTLTVGANTLSLASSTVSGTPTWSSSQNITLSQAAQGSVTSLGTLTGLTLGEAANVVLGTTTGTKIGTGTTQKLGFFNATPVVQITGSTDVLAGLVTLGLRAASSNPPLDVGTGTVSLGTLTFNGLPGSGTVTGQPTWNSNQNITLGTAAQPNVTSLGTLTGLTMGGTLTMGANTLALASATISGTPTWSSNQAITLSTAAQGNVTSLGTLTGLTMGGTAQVSWATGGSPSATTPQLLGPTDAGLFISANSPGSGTGKALTLTAGAGVGVGGASPGGAASLTGGAGANGSLGGLVSLSGGAPGSGSTDKGSGGVAISTGLPTGAGTADIVMQSGFILGSGSTAQTAYDRQRITSKTFTCSTTTGTNNVYLTLSNAVSNSGVGCSVDYVLEVGDGSNHWSTITGVQTVAGENRNGTVVATCTTAGTSNQAISSTTTFTSLACTTTVAISGTNIQIRLTPSWSGGTPNTVRVTYQARCSGQGSLTPS